MRSGSKLPALLQASCVILGKPLTFSELQLLHLSLKRPKHLSLQMWVSLTKPGVSKGLWEAVSPALLCQMKCYKYVIHRVPTSFKISQLDQISYPWSLLFNCLNKCIWIKRTHIVEKKGGGTRFKSYPCINQLYHHRYYDLVSVQLL